MATRVRINNKSGTVERRHKCRICPKKEGKFVAFKKQRHLFAHLKAEHSRGKEGW